MKCTYCGTENNNNYKFCLKCGAQLTNDVPVKTKKMKKSSKRISGKSIIVWGIVVLALVVLFNFGRNMFKQPKFSLAETNIMKVYKEDEDQTYILNNTSLLKNAFDGRGSYSPRNVDGTIGAFIAGNDNAELILVCENDAMVIDDEVEDVVVSASGQYIAYLKKDGTLLICDKEGNRSSIADDVVIEAGTMLSPDGKCVSYVVQDEEDYILYVYDGKKTNKIGKNLICVGLTNSAKKIYCYNIENTGLYICSLDGDSTKLAAEVGSRFMFNETQTELLFSSGGSWYLTMNGRDKIKISGTSNNIYPIGPDSMGYTYVYAYDYDNNTIFNISIYGLNSLSNQVYRESGANTLFYINEDWDKKSAGNGVDGCSFSDDGEVVFFTRNHQLYKTSISDFGNRTLMAEEVVDFQVTSDGSAVYYTDLTDTLWYQKGIGKPKRIADDVYSLDMTHDDYALFITDYGSDSGVLYSSKNGGSKKKISDDVYYLLVRGTAAYYGVNYDKEEHMIDLYGTTKKSEFEFIIEEIEHYGRD